MTRTTFRIAINLGALVFLGMAGCAELNDPYYGGGSPYGGGYGTGYNRGGYNSGYGYRPSYDSYYDRERERDYERRRRLEYERERAREERERLEDERERVERERRRLEQERRHIGGSMTQTPPPPPPAPHEERCPAGYQETNRKCTDAERKRGCSDIKMDSGKRCIRL